MNKNMIDENNPTINWTNTCIPPIQLAFDISNFKAQSFGTLIDKIIKYGVDKSSDPNEYYCSCYGSVDNQKYDSSDKFISNCVVCDEYIDNIKKIFVGLKSGENIVDTELKIYGECDFISDDYIIEIKTGKDILKDKNYLQLLYFAIMYDKHKIAIIDPMTGDIYSRSLNNNKMKLFKEFITYRNQQ
jgi:hypothetical protein